MTGCSGIIFQCVQSDSNVLLFIENFFIVVNRDNLSYT